MYACVCHAVTDEDVRDHVEAGACSAKEVRAACGMRPGCGSCVNRIRALIEQHAAAEPGEAIATAAA
ncbi:MULTISPECIES: (2Fe-2S)-binding protein [Actinoallomurus]|uniref:(2Fe-2S)-binding protein n=1 Tax=Actinoallomurus TaxID=667113 RepID=UPI0020936AD6|nr:MULTISPECIES: (2Fe-2S)-binding protein [Actinoallomurus]MCO5969263.1 (2Fe-2S)-binding protein [Actinoallomurus soli]MCO5998661.1 (2Fe-2S)-binding protein [Actinoallomurus rhizosphaericola]